MNPEKVLHYFDLSGGFWLIRTLDNKRGESFTITNGGSYDEREEVQLTSEQTAMLREALNSIVNQNS